MQREAKHPKLVKGMQRLKGSVTGLRTVGNLEQGRAEVDALDEDEGAEERDGNHDVLAPDDDDHQRHQARGAHLHRAGRIGLWARTLTGVWTLQGGLRRWSRWCTLLQRQIGPRASHHDGQDGDSIGVAQEDRVDGGGALV